MYSPQMVRNEKISLLAAAVLRWVIYRCGLSTAELSPRELDSPTEMTNPWQVKRSAKSVPLPPGAQSSHGRTSLSTARQAI